MSKPYLEVTFHRGQPIAAYLYLKPGEKSSRTSKAGPGLIVDFDLNDTPIGIEITAPMVVTASDVNEVLKKLGLPELNVADLAPLEAA